MSLSFTILRLFFNPTFDFWAPIVVVVLLSIAYLAIRFTRGNAIKYITADVPNSLKVVLLLLQGSGSLIASLILPNNYLNRFRFFNSLYAKSDAWIVATMVVLFILFVIVIGIIFNFLLKGKIEINKQ
jgi:hypothetical protein